MDEKEPQTVTLSTDSSGNPAPENAVPDLLLHGQKLVSVFVSFILAFFLVALDQTIISTALPTIASHFQAVSDLTWIASAYFLPQAALMLFYGKLLSLVAAKSVFLFSIGIFEIGSLLCAVAPSVSVLIFGRAVSGVGSAGLWVSIMSIVAQITTMEQRPVLMGSFGAVYAVASITGPLIGGVFSDKVTWRDADINLPVGGLALATVFFVLPYTPAARSDGSLSQKWLRIDWIGTTLIMSTTTTLLLALQWGGNEKPWNDSAVISTLVLFAVLFPALVVWEIRKGEDAILLMRLFKEKTMSGACLEALLINIAFILAIYYLPFLYQVKGHSAARSGIDIIPFMVAGVLTSFISAGVIQANGKPWPWLFFFPPLAAIAFGLLFTADQDSSFARIAGYQVLAGVGLGSATQNVVVVVQGHFAERPNLVPQATAAVTIMQLLGGALGLALSQAVFSSELRKAVSALAPDLSPEVRVAVLASISAVHSLPDPQRANVLRAYAMTIDKVFVIGVPAASLGALAALLIKRSRIISKKAKPAPPGPDRSSGDVELAHI